MAKRWRTFILVPAVVLACSILGGVYAPVMPELSAATASEEDDVKASLRAFTSIYRTVEDNFADVLTPDKSIYKGAIPGMLRTLDPHSSFFDPRDFQAMRDDQRGRYYGVGMTVQERNHKTIVIQPFPGSPAYRAGIRPGDTILEVNDKKTEGLNTTEVADLLKGPRGTKVQVVVAREGNEKPLVFNIVRDEIPRKSVQDGFFVKPGIAFVDVETFSDENTSREVEENLRRLGEQNIKGLILDLRENPGGLLNEGVAVAGRFLQKGQVVVSHRGRASAEKPYFSTRGNGGFDYPIVVLVNRYSASAAEIVAGALQDHDRGWILGENTFGKGLVQTVYPLDGNTGLALTTAKYYTPSNRLIQRDYTNISFLDYYYHKDIDQKNLQDMKMTDSGRTVYGGGGIAPDEKFESPKLNRFQSDLIRKYALFNFTARYFGARSSTKLPKGWEPDNDVLNDFHAYLLKDSGVTFTEAEWAQDHEWIKQQLRGEMYVTAFGADESRRLRVEIDPEVQKAIESMPKAKALLDNAKKMLVQRTLKPSAN
ncbi:MAG: S41 family peptidase [Acidobacteria bacterium]|nr:S41 family peptidase [Acidobacteriota bacterium]